MVSFQAGIVIVIVFIFFLGGGYSCTEKKASRVAVVNGSYIGIREYQFGNQRNEDSILVDLI